MTDVLIRFDTLAYVKKLRAAGMHERLAEIQAEALKELTDRQNQAILNLKTKQRIEDRTSFGIETIDTKATIEKFDRNISGFSGKMYTAFNAIHWKLNMMLGIVIIFGTFFTITQYI